MIYDVSHNIAKVEQHVVDGKERTLVSTQEGVHPSLPPHHSLIAVDYQVRTEPSVVLSSGGMIWTVLNMWTNLNRKAAIVKKKTVCHP